MYGSCAVAISIFAALTHGYANPGSCSGTCNVHDPGLIQRESDGTYFRFSTGNKISYARSSSIEGPWTAVGSMLPEGSSINKEGSDDLWVCSCCHHFLLCLFTVDEETELSKYNANPQQAPDVQTVNGAYHVYYSVSTSTSQDSAIGLATSDTMEEGSWTDKGSTGISSSPSKAYNAIDANLFNDDGTYYMNFGSFWQDLFQAPMDSAASKTASSSYNIAYDPAGEHAIEGAYLYKYGSYYYLFFSSGKCCGYDTSRPATGEEYKIKVCRSSSPTGDFVSGPIVMGSVYADDV